MKPRLITLILAFANTLVFTQLAVLALYPALIARATTWSTPTTVGEIIQRAIVFLVLLLLASGLTLFGRDYGHALANRAQRIGPLDTLGLLGRSTLAALIGTLCIILILRRLPFGAWSAAPLHDFWWGAFGYNVELPILLGFSFIVPSILDKKKARKVFHGANLSAIQQLDTPAALLHVLERFTATELRRAVAERLALVLTKTSDPEDPTIRTLLTFPAADFRKVMAEKLPDELQLLLEQFAALETDEGIRRLLFQRLANWQVLLGHYRAAENPDTRTQIGRRLLITAKDHLTPAQAAEIAGQADLPPDFRILACRQLDWRAQLALLGSEHNPDLRKALESSLVLQLKDAIPIADVPALLDQPQLPIQILRQAMRRLDDDALLRWAHHADNERAIVATEAIRKPRNLLAIATDPQTDRLTKLTATNRIKDQAVLGELVNASELPEVRLAAIERLHDPHLRAPALSCPHLDVAEAVIAKTEDASLLEALDQRTDLSPHAKQLLQKRRQSLVTVAPPEPPSPTACTLPTITAGMLSRPLRESSSLGPAGRGGSSFSDAIRSLNQRDDHGAIRTFETALALGLDPLRQGYVHANLGLLRLKQDDLTKTVQHFTKVFDSTEVLYESAHDAAQHLHLIYAEQGRASEAALLAELAGRTQARLRTSLSPEQVTRVRKLAKVGSAQKSVPPSTVIQTLVAECKWHFDNAARYDSCKEEFARREREIVRPLGEKLHEEGGLRRMREVYEEVSRICQSRYGKPCRSALEMKWNGVGDWRS